MEPVIQLTKLESQQQGAQQAPLLQVIIHTAALHSLVAHSCHELQDCSHLCFYPKCTTLCRYILLHSDTLMQAHWTLQTYLKLPWRPFINVIGATEYSLNAEANQVCRAKAKLVVLIDLLQCIYTGHAQ